MNYQNEINDVSIWMEQYVKQSGTKGIVVGLSGGIDSSVMACLAVKAVGTEKVIGVSLPCQTREDMKDDALALACNLGIPLKVVNIEKAYESIIEGLTQIAQPDILTMANVKARLRMTTLYGFANLVNCLVIGTGNLSELMVGYFTKYGDGGVDMEPIGDYYKTEVYKMAEFMPQIPENVKTKAPSADLWDGQTDEEELGMSYGKLDKILMALKTLNREELNKFDIEEVEKVQKMISRSIHKNNLPPRYNR